MISTPQNNKNCSASAQRTRIDLLDSPALDFPALNSGQTLCSTTSEEFMSASPAQAVDQAKLHEFVMKAVGEMGAAMNAALILIGDKLGLYKAMASAGPL